MREFQELSQNELAKMAGIPRPTISAIENNRQSRLVQYVAQAILVQYIVQFRCPNESSKFF